jgi:hypothetical protein
MSYTENKPTGLWCLNCKKPVEQAHESTWVPTVGWTIRKKNHCDCSMGFYKTNITRAGLVARFWKGRIG